MLAGGKPHASLLLFVCAWQSLARALTNLLRAPYKGALLQRVPARAFHAHCTELCRIFSSPLLVSVLVSVSRCRSRLQQK